MGKKDDYQSHYFENKKRFADIYNGCLFGGKELMKPEDLEETDSVIVIPSQDIASTKVICDKIRKWKGYYASILVLESQSYIDYRMVLRAMKDDLANYEKQRTQAYQCLLDSGHKPSSNEFLSRTPENFRLHPVITLVIYVGTDSPWSGKTELYDLMNIDEELKPYVSNYRFNLYDYHDHNDFSVFKTENQTLFETLSLSDDKEKMMQYLENSSHNNTKDPHVFSAILGCIGVKPTKELLTKMYNKETGGYDMCKALRDMIDEGITIGKEQGITIGKISILFDLTNNNTLSLAEAAKMASTTEEHFMELVAQYNLNS